GGSPENPQFVSQLRFNYTELYGPGWLAGAHSIFRYKDYVFLGDEVLPAQFDLTDRTRIPSRGIVHVINVSDILNPRKVAEYEIPEEGAQNRWVRTMSCTLVITEAEDVWLTFPASSMEICTGKDARSPGCGPAI